MEELQTFLDDKPIEKVETPDHVLQKLGGCGKFQFLICFIIQLMKMVVCWGMIGITLFAYVPNWRCSAYENEDQNDTTTDRTISNMTSLSANTSTSTSEHWNKQCASSSGHRCVQFDYETGITTLVTKFDLVCGHSWVTATAASLQMVGMCIGSIMAGPLADAVGRKKPFVASVTILAVFHVVCYFAPSWTVYAAARLVIGIGSAFYLSIYCTLQSEYTLSRWRAVAIGFPSWAVEAALFTLVAYLFPDWRTLSLIMAALGIISTCIGLILPESFRWLVSVNKFDEARQIVNLVARTNGREEPDFEPLRRTISTIVEEERSKFSVVKLVRTRSLLIVTVKLTITWFSMGLIAYGINFGIQKLSGNIFLNLFIFSVSSIPSKLLSIWLQNRFGRKPAAVVAFTITGLGGLIVAIVQYIDTPYRASITNYCALAAVSGVDGTWGPIQTLSVEVYPTVVRNTGFAFLSTFGRLGAVVGPQLVYFEEFIPGVLYMMVALLSMMSIVCILWLPETCGLVLIDKLATSNFTHNRMKE